MKTAACQAVKFIHAKTNRTNSHQTSTPLRVPVCLLCLCCLLWQALLPLLAQAHDDRLITTNLPGGASSTTHYNAIGKVDSTVDALQRSTHYSYNERGERTSTTYADGSSTRVVLNAEGMAEKSFDRAGRGSQTVYDSLGRAVAMLSLGTDGQPLLHADGTPIASRTVYDDAGRATRSIDQLGHLSDTVYNAAGEATDSTIYDQNAQGQAVPLTTHTDYDKDGRAYKVTDALGRFSVTRYDDGGRAYQTEHYDRNGNLLTTDKTHFDDAGRVDLTTDAAQHQKRMRYDSLGRLAQVILATQGTPSADGTGQYDLVTRFGYDEMGRKVWQTDANNNATRFGYDERGRMVWRAMPNGQVERMSYNDGGQLESSTDFRGYVTRYAYDLRGRMTLKQPDARLNEATLTWSYPNENTRVATRGSLQTTYTSNAQRGWLQSVQSPTGTLSYGYDDGGQKTSVSAPSGLTSYSYDVLGRVQNVSDQPSGTSNPTAIAAYDYDNVGNLKSVSRGNGIVTSYGYDELNRLSDLVNAKGASEVSRFHYPVRADGKRTGLTERLLNADLVNNAPRVSNRAVTYGYDDAGRLTREAGDDGLGVAYQTSYSYDKVGNRTDTLYKRATTAAPNTLSRTTTVASTFNANDWLTGQSIQNDGGAVQTQSYTYDRSGSQLTEQNGSNTPQENDWGFDGKLQGTKAQGQQNGGTTYTTDAAGNRVGVTLNTGLAQQKTTRYLVDENTSYASVLEERAPDTNDTAAQELQARYVWGNGLAPLAMWRKGSDGTVRLFFMLTDGQDSVRQLTNSSGSVTDSYFYDAWGNGLGGGSGTTVNPFRYTGQQLDPSGKYFLRARYYDPGTGRFLSQDPEMGSESDPITLHRYLYSGVEPVNNVDPSGEDFTLGSVFTAINMGINLWGAASDINSSMIAGMAGNHLAAAAYRSSAYLGISSILLAALPGGNNLTGGSARVGASVLQFAQAGARVGQTVNDAMALLNLTRWLMMAVADSDGFSSSGGGSGSSGSSGGRSEGWREKLQREQTNWEEYVRDATGGTRESVPRSAGDPTQGELTELDSVANSYIFDAKASKPSSWSRWWNSAKPQIRLHVQIAQSRGKQYVVWFQHEQDPQLYQKLRENGALVMVGEQGR